jgi:lipid-binding SYLF domain-containing protein
MTRACTIWGPSLLLIGATAAPLLAASHELKTVEAAADVVREFAGPVHRIPASVLLDATGVAIVPRMVKARILFDARFGHGVVVLHRPDGSWSNPVFVKLEGFGLGGEAGFESTDLVLIFKTRTGLEHLLQGREKLTLGADATIAAGPVGREAEVSVRGRKTEVFSYTRNRGLFAGVSVTGAALIIDREANESFYGIRGGHPAEVLTHRAMPAAECIRIQLTHLLASPETPPTPPGSRR